MHIYAFGSICRGDVSLASDVDLLAIVDGHDTRFDPNLYSIYSYQRVGEIWREGNPFAWHLSLESRLLFAEDGRDYLSVLGKPEPYASCLQDCEKFYSLFQEARSSALSGGLSTVFDLSTVFLSIRNFATCFSLGFTAQADFSRHSALRLGSRSIQLPQDSYKVLERARILCTRGHGSAITPDETSHAIRGLGGVHHWMVSLLDEVKVHERVR